MARIKTGDYAINFFDSYGARLKFNEEIQEKYQQAGSLTEAKLLGALGIEELEGVHSYQVIRVIFNSLDPQAKF